MCFFLSWCLRPIMRDAIPAGDNLLLVAWCTPWPLRASTEWVTARDARSGEPEWGGAARDGRGGEAEWGCAAQDGGACGEMATATTQSGRADGHTAQKSTRRASKSGDIFFSERRGRHIERQACWASTVACRSRKTASGQTDVHP
jgi:hypothetical protein